MRIHIGAILHNDLRRRLLDRLDPCPGESVGGLARHLEVDYKTALHHVRVLERAGLLVMRRAGRRRLCYLPGRVAEPSPPAREAAALRALDAGARSPTKLARVLGIPRGTAGSLLEALAARGLVRRDGAWWTTSRS